MSCNCDSRLDSIMKFLEDMRAEIGFVKTKCIRIEKEILGITAESELNAEALMETTTVRHLVEKLAFDVTVLTEESSKARAEADHQKEIKAASEDLLSKFSDATIKTVEDLKLKYEAVAPEMFQTEYSMFLKEFRSETEKVLFKREFSSSVIRDLVGEVARTTDSDSLYVTHFSANYKETVSFYRGKIVEFIEKYSEVAIRRIQDSPEWGLKYFAEFSNSFNARDGPFGSLNQELLNSVREINEEVEANRSLLSRLAEDYHQYFSRTRNTKPFVSMTGELPPQAYKKLELLEAVLKEEIKVSNPKLFSIYLEKFWQNIEEISQPSS